MLTNLPRLGSYVPSNAESSSSAQLQENETNKQMDPGRQSKSYEELFHLGYKQLVDRVYDEEKTRHHPLVLKCQLSEFREICVPVLLSMERDALLGVVSRSLPKMFKHGNENLDNLYGSTSKSNSAWLARANGTAPAIYAMYYVDNNGDPLLLKHKMKIVMLIRTLWHPQYSFHSFILAYLAEPKEPVFAEIILTALAEAYVDLYTGLCIYQAGMNNTTGKMNHSSASNVNALWRESEEWRQDNTPFLENLKILSEQDDERTSLQEAREAELDKQIAELRKELEPYEPNLDP
ncbi:hypothetical protein K458DRAFT_459302 [Lentithecium fluviatile CBS 122367]|uniref:Uncharacterized protein n=1 Tax=Lentithecium fluviatile CBS 122367 TaxID=1168545 RepID=A0A6G1JJ95_9PLEO|nr:hypothetical protein K458DRAFT_459302 [Lentithecium fluviatile CBS 122367]